MSATFAPVMAIIARWFVKRRALMTTIAVAGYSLGTAILPQLATYSIDAFGWRNSYILLGIIVSIVVVGVSLFLRLSPEKMGLKPYGYNNQENTVQNIQLQGSTLKEALHTRQFWIIGIVTMFLWFCYTHVMVNGVIYMTDLGISNIAATNMISLIGLVNGGIVLVLGFMADKYGNWKLLIGSMAIFALALTVFPFAKSEWAFYAIAVLIGLAFCGSPILMMIIPAEIFGLKTIGLLIAIFNFCSTIGQFLSPVLTSYIFDITNSYNIILIICILIGLLMLVLTLFLRSKGVVNNLNEQNKIKEVSTNLNK
jgi:MFS family permease